MSKTSRCEPNCLDLETRDTPKSKTRLVSTIHELYDLIESVFTV